MEPAMIARNRTHQQLLKIQRLPFGLYWFSIIVSFTAPFFRTISPRFIELEPGTATARMRKRWGVTNHIGTVHAIALANLCEFVGGTLMEVSIPANMRWIPKGMNIRYLAKAETDVTARCTIEDIEWHETEDVLLKVEVTDTEGKKVAEAEIPMYVSPRKA
jgi:acyl-coenzyme A thioesterase PaaI-like protein